MYNCTIQRAGRQSTHADDENSGRRTGNDGDRDRHPAPGPTQVEPLPVCSRQGRLLHENKEQGDAPKGLYALCKSIPNGM